jgi:hypothetical protein
MRLGVDSAMFVKKYDSSFYWVTLYKTEDFNYLVKRFRRVDGFYYAKIWQYDKKNKQIIGKPYAWFNNFHERNYL